MIIKNGDCGNYFTNFTNINSIDDFALIEGWNRSACAYLKRLNREQRFNALSFIPLSLESMLSQSVPLHITNYRLSHLY